MSKESALSFRAAVAEDAAIQEQLTKATSPEELVAVGKANGFDFTVDECKDVISSIFSGATELNEFELEMVSGGASLGNLYGALANSTWVQTGYYGPNGEIVNSQGQQITNATHT